MTMSRWPSAIARSRSCGVPRRRSTVTSAARFMKRPIAVCRPSSGLVTTPSTMPMRSRPTSWPRCSPMRWSNGVEVGEELAGRLVGRLAEGGQPEAAAAAVAEPPAELPLERGEVGRERRCREVEGELRLGEAMRLGDRDEDAEQAEIDVVEAAHASVLSVAAADCEAIGSRQRGPRVRRLVLPRQGRLPTADCPDLPLTSAIFKLPFE